MKSIVRTVYGAAVQGVLYTGVPYTKLDHTTLNERFNINPNVLISQYDYPQMKYYAIGYGGHIMEVDSDGFGIPVPVQHKSTDASCYRPIPFIMREMNNDLTPQQRESYALRRYENFNGIQYICYYLRRIDYSQAEQELTMITSNNDGTVAYEPFVPNTSNLNPDPQILSNTNTNVLKGKYVSATILVELEFNEFETEELRNVANIRFANENKAIISEIALVSGLDRKQDITESAQGTFTMNEVVAAQVCHFTNTFKSAAIDNKNFVIGFNIGATEPLFDIG